MSDLMRNVTPPDFAIATDDELRSVWRFLDKFVQLEGDGREAAKLLLQTLAIEDELHRRRRAAGVMSVTQHNWPTVPRAGPMEGPDCSGCICILAADGRLFDPFASRSDAAYWCFAQEFSTFDLLAL